MNKYVKSAAAAVLAVTLLATGCSSKNGGTSAESGVSISGESGAESVTGDNTSMSDSLAGFDQSGFSVSWKADNTWEDGGNKCGTVELNVTNNTGSPLTSWTITIPVPDGFSITSGWSGNFSVDGTTLTITNAEYNGEVPAGGVIGIGFNYSSPSVFVPPESIGINGVEGSSQGGTNNGGNNGDNYDPNNGQNNNPDRSDQNQNDPAPSENVQQLIERSDKAVQGDDWLHTDGNRILDKNGKQVWLTGVNWFGYNTGTNTFDGLWNSQLRGSVKAIADHGFNLIRVPISAELLNQWSRGEYPKANYNNATNPELNDMNSLQIFDYFLKLAEENGMKVMPDIHCA